jgi:uncharacterized membrane protein
MTLVFYFTLPDMVAYHHTKSGTPDGFINKQQFFYAMVGIILISNILIQLLGKTLGKTLFGILAQKSPWKSNKEQTKNLAESAGNALNATVNTFVFLCLVALSQINSDKEQILRSNNNWLLIIGLILILGAICYLPVRLLFGKPSNIAQ